MPDDSSFPTHWPPERTQALVVGVFSSRHGTGSATTNAPPQKRYDRDLVNVLYERGVPRAAVTYLADRDATHEAIQIALDDRLASLKPDEFFLLYYGGHGYKNKSGEAFFASYDATLDGENGWSVAGLVARFAKDFRGRGAVVLADAPYSAALVRAFAKEPQSPSAAVFASSDASEQSRAGILTRLFVDGLAGRLPAAGQSDTLSVRSFADLVAKDLAFADRQYAAVTAVGGFSPDLILGPAPRLEGEGAGERVEVERGWLRRKGRVLETRPGEARVRYYGDRDPVEEWVPKDALSRREPVIYEAGREVEVRWFDDWFPATVVDIRRNLHLVRYRNFSEVWNEWVGSDRLREASEIPQDEGET